HRETLLDVPLRLEAGLEDHVLPAEPPGHADQPDHGEPGEARSATGGGLRGRRLLSGEPGDLRVLPVDEAGGATAAVAPPRSCCSPVLKGITDAARSRHGPDAATDEIP